MRNKIYKSTLLIILCTMILVPVKVSAEEIDGETEYISMEDDPEVTVETVDEILMPTYSTAYALNWSVGNNVLKQTKDFSKSAGSTISISVKIGPTV